MKKKFLIIRFSSIGDIVLTTPVIRCLRKEFPDSVIHFLTKKNYAKLLSNNPNLNEIKTLEESIFKTCKNLRKENYDSIIDLHNNLRTFLVKFFLMKKSYTFNKINWAKWLVVNLKINKLPKIHIVDRYLKTIENLGIENDNLGLDFYIDENASFNHFNLPEKYLVYAIGGQHETKKLPFKKQIELLEKINKPIVLLGGKEDEEQGNLLSKNVDFVINLCGKTNVDESALIIKNSETIYTHDTGMMHIAAALNKNIYVIWGNTIPEFGMYPYYPKNSQSKFSSFEVQNLNCRPCSKIGFKTCPKGHFNCMNLQNFNS